MFHICETFYHKKKIYKLNKNKLDILLRKLIKLMGKRVITVQNTANIYQTIIICLSPKLSLMNIKCVRILYK